MPSVDNGRAAQAQNPAQQQPVQDNATQVPPTPPVTGTPAAADDVDLIEKAWVEKAKQIVHGTHTDPYAQSKQLNQMKADYIKKRYGRAVKVDE